MFKASLVSVLVFLFALPLFAQTVDTAWVRRYNGPGNGNDVACAIVVDASGNVYVTGTSYDSVTSNDYATIKYNSNGDTAWVRRYNGPGNSSDGARAMALDPGGYVYITGGGGTVKYDALGNQLWSDSLLGSDIAVGTSGNVYVTGANGTIKYDSQGNLLWIASSGGSVLTVDDYGNIYKAANGYVTTKLYPNGDTAWVRLKAGKGNDEVADIAVDALGNVYVTGTSWDTTSAGGNYQQIGTIKYDNNGDEEWVRMDGNHWLDRGTAIVTDDSGNVYVAGLSVHVLYGWYPNQYVVIKYGSNGDMLWDRRYYESWGRIQWSRAYAICIDRFDNVYVTGTSVDTINSGTGYDYATLKYDPAGNQLWVQRYNGYGNSGDGANAIAVDGSGNVYVTGYSGGDYATVKYWQNYPPVFAAPDSSWFFCGADTIRYRVTATDPDVGDTLTLSGPGIPTPLIGISPLSADVKNYVTAPGTYNYVYTVTDKRGASAQDTATWEITIDSPPDVGAPDSSKWLCVPDTVRFMVTATDIDVVDTLTLSGPGITAPVKGVSPLYADIKLYITSSGTYNYVYKVTDECGFSDYDTATLIVTMNSLPTVTAPDSSEFYCLPDSIRFKVTATDPDGTDTLTLSGSGIPAPVKGLSPLNADVEFYIDSSGTFRYVYDVTDHCGFTDSDTAVWVVIVNRPPNQFSHLSPAQDSIMIYPSGLEHIVNFRWETSTDPNPGDQVKYDLSVSTSSTFHPDSTVVHHGLSTNEYTDTIAIGRCYWKVRAYDNCTGTWSTQIWTFLSAIRGDANADKKVTVADVVYLVNFLFKNGPAPYPFQVGDVNCDGYVTVSDVVYLINYLFKGGPPPCEPQ